LDAAARINNREDQLRQTDDLRTGGAMFIEIGREIFEHLL
jgi:hypothetical protein